MTNESDQSEVVFDDFYPGIPGLNALLLQGEEPPKGFCFPLKSGLHIVVYGPPGVGKSILATQMAVAAAYKEKWRVVYFTKDTPPEVLCERIRQLNLFKGSARSESARLGGTGWQRRIWIGTDELHVLLLSRLMEELSKSEEEKKQEERRRLEGEFSCKWNDEKQHMLTMASFTETPIASMRLDRYALAKSLFHCLGYLQPELRPVFDIMEEQWKLREKERAKQEEVPGKVLIVCDSLSPKTVESHLRAKAQFARPFSKDSKELTGPTPIFLFVMESSEVPEAMTVAFPPDMQIRLGVRPESHHVTTRTIRLVKTRFQKSLDEETPFVILGPSEYDRAVRQHIVDLEDLGGGAGTKERLREPKDKEPHPLGSPRPGIEIMPPVARELLVSVATIKTPQPERNVRFHINGPDASTLGLDSFTKEGSLDGGGCTLLVTQNRCGSTALSLHYLLAQIADASKQMDKKLSDSSKSQPSQPVGNPADVGDSQVMTAGSKPPASVLNISFSGDVTEILHTVWRYPAIRGAVWQGGPPGVDSSEDEGAEKAWSNLHGALSGHLRGATGDTDLSPPRHRLYMVPLRDGKAQEQKGYFHIYVPDFTWVTPEEAMERVARLLQPGPSAHQRPPIQRVVLDAIGRLQARWPLIENLEVFVSGVVALCAQHAAEVMLIDDTAENRESSALFPSRWAAAAQNIIRLRRMPFQGTETVTVELLKATGRVIKANRPYEVVFRQDGGDFRSEMLVEDNFRGHTGLSIGRPERCELTVDLTYDGVRTPLYRYLIATKASIEAAMDRVKVNLLGPGDWTGINSAFNNLSSAARDTCRVVAIDGIWLTNLLRNNVLHRLSREEFTAVLPAHVRKKLVECRRSDRETELDVDQYYATHCVTVAENALKKKRGVTNREEGTLVALPMRHNWGVLVVTEPTKPLVRHVFLELAKTLQGLQQSGDPLDGLRGSVLSCLVEHMPEPTSGRDVELIARESLDKMKGTAEGLESKEGGREFAAFARAAPVVLSLLCGGAEPHGDDPSYAGWKRIWGDTSAFDGKTAAAVWRKIWEKPDEAIEYKHLADFRTDYWHDFWYGGWVERVLSEMATAPEKGMAVDLGLALFPRIDFFGLAFAVPESVVSFLLELLLAHCNEIFQDVGGGLLRFSANSTDDKVVEGWVGALTVFYRLLSKTQRRKISIGPSGGQEGDQLRSHHRLVTVSQYHEAFKEWPSCISLFSREWLTTVEELRPQYDVRERLHLCELPTGPANSAYWEKVLQNERYRKARGGPTVGGTWYLGILRGGNSELATDVMRDILSDENEEERLLNGCGAAVSARFYAQDILSDENEEERTGTSAGGTQGRDSAGSVGADGRPSGALPYQSVMAAVYGKGVDSEAAWHKVFPFYRNHLVNYLEVSPILYELVRRVMRVQKLEEGALHTKESQDGLKKEIRGHVCTALDRLVARQEPEKQVNTRSTGG